MSRRLLTLAVVSLASFAVAACGTSPTAPQSGMRTPGAASADVIAPPPADSAGRSGWIGSNG
ncbi:MAG: hypothetical protein JWL60_1653 [Gemmatimonadetes bacterium]|jgi:hypothetical protein|nr:hypothetical protein [Gemmatimonadota bacterium]